MGVAGRKKAVLVLWCINAALLVMLVPAFFPDLNGRVLGMNEVLSVSIATCICAAGLAVDCVLGIIDVRKRLVFVVTYSLVYLLMLWSVVGYDVEIFSRP